MGASSYGGIRLGASGAARWSGSGAAAPGATPPAAARTGQSGAGPSNPNIGPSYAMRQPGSPYSQPATAQTRGRLHPHQVLYVLVLLEVLALVGLRHGFRHHHGG